MKKKIVLCLMVGCMMAVFAGCDLAKTKETAATEMAAEEGNEKKDRKTEEEDAQADEKAAADGPVLGGENVEGYEGFTHLYEELLMTETEENEETGKKERKKLTVYIPDDEYTTADGNYAYSDSMGVNFRVELEPYMRYDADDYLPEENLDDFIANKYDPFYTAEYKDMVINKAEASGDGVISTVEYCCYDEWDEFYYSVFCTYYLVELAGGENVLVSIEVTSSEVTGKTEQLLEELEQFYQFTIDWDEERAAKKSADYEANGTDNSYSTGSLLFELPEGWKEDGDMYVPGADVYAPEGDSNASKCLVAVYEDYIGYDEEVDLDLLVSSEGEAMMKEMLGESVSEYSSELCETNLGEAAKLTCTVSDGEDTVTIVLYMVVDDSKMFRLMSFEMAGAEESAQIVLDGIMQTGQIRE